jgi:CRISPR/Cas system-associated exonuclease Cas4 (RecB family)
MIINHSGNNPIADTVISRAGDRYGVAQQREGIHLTDCLYCLRKAYWNKTNPLPPSEKELMYFLTGFGLQDALLADDNQSFAELDGIRISPDYWEGGELAELKTTRIGRKRLLDNDIPTGWIAQIQGYAKVLGVTRATLIVMPLLQPEILTFELEFTQDELDNNWDYILERKDELENALVGDYIPIAGNEEWECRDCRYKDRCGE